MKALATIYELMGNHPESFDCCLKIIQLELEANNNRNSKAEIEEVLLQFNQSYSLATSSDMKQQILLHVIFYYFFIIFFIIISVI